MAKRMNMECIVGRENLMVRHYIVERELYRPLERTHITSRLVNHLAAKANVQTLRGRARMQVDSFAVYLTLD